MAAPACSQAFKTGPAPARSTPRRQAAARLVCTAAQHQHQQQQQQQPDAPAVASRRGALAQAAGLAAAAIFARPALATSLPPEDGDDAPVLCDPACAAALADKPRVTTASGLQYIDIVEGKGVSPPKGYQVTLNYVAMTPEGRIFDSSLEKAYAYDIRVGAGQVIAGLDEGVLTMKTGGTRRLYIPGPLAFPKGLASAAGRPRVPPASPVVFDVQLLRIPGVSDDDEDE